MLTPTSFAHRNFVFDARNLSMNLNLKGQFFKLSDDTDIFMIDVGLKRENLNSKYVNCK